MTSLTGCLTNLRGEPKEDGPTPRRFVMRGEPDELLGESGGALPAGNMEGNELFEPAVELQELPDTLSGEPALASSSKDFTRRVVSGSESHCENNSATM